MPYTTSITPLASAARTTSGVSSATDIGSATTADLTLDVTVDDGTTLTVTIETARTSTATTWTTVVGFAAATSVSSQRVVYAGLSRYIRVRWVIVGTGFTFGVSGDSVLVYSTPSIVKEVLAGQSLISTQDANYTDAELDGFVQDATDEVSGSLGAIYELPLSAWGRDVKRKTGELAAYYAMLKRGYSPDEPSGKVLRTMFDDVQRWLGRVREQEIELQHIVDATPEVEEGGAYIVTNESRGWGTP